MYLYPLEQQWTPVYRCEEWLRGCFPLGSSWSPLITPELGSKWNF